MTDALASATGRFLASFGSKVAALIRTSRTRLTQMDPAQANKLKERAIAEITAISRRDLSAALERFARGRINEQQLRESLQTTIRRQALTAAIVGVGGVGNITENVLEAVRRSITNQFRFLDGFISDIQGRDITQRDFARLAQYANTAHTLSQTANRQFRLDTLGGEGDQQLEERRVLGGAEHCPDCIELASLGWVPAGQLPPIGQDTVCGNNCRCTIETRVRSDSNTYVTGSADSEL